MTFKDDVKKKTGEFLSNSIEMFDKIFAQATREIRIRRKPKPAAQKSAPAPSPEASRTKGKSPEVSTGSEKTVPTYKASEKVKAGLKPKPSVKRKTRKGSGLLRACLLFILLLVVAGFAANYFAIIDFSVIPDLLGLGPKQVVQAPVPKKQPAKPPEKPPQTVEKQAPATAPSPASKEEKLIELETPTTIAQPTVPKEQVVEEPQPAPPPQSQVPSQPAAPEPPPAQTMAPQYPYAVYLGSFKAPEAVKKAVSDYQEKGFSAYWARVDLGDKGVWYRFFTGHFETKEEVEKYLYERKIQGASLGNTKYAALIGRYGTDKEAEDQKRALFAAGFCPYVIKHDDGRSYVYSGAFDRKEHAEKERSDLAAKGIKSEVVER